MNEKEKNRFLEIIFYLYFSKKTKNIVGNPYFWKHIEEFCKLYVINYTLIVRAIRLLAKPENVPSPNEQMYLFDKAGMSVRNIKAVSGIYWQKQVELKKENEANKPEVRNIIVSPVSINAIIKFIQGMDDVTGIFKYLGKEIT